MSPIKFSDLGLSEPILRALNDCGYTNPTPIQEAAIPIVQSFRDLIATAQTGTGKTAAFTLPIIDDIAGRVANKGDRALALVLTPTRELALQIDENILEYGRHVGVRTCVCVGGVAVGPQVDALRRGVDFIVATPGRLIDLIERGEVYLDEVEFLILDEADRMLDLGFIHDVRWIAEQVPTPRQTLLFSATMSAGVRSLASTVQKHALSVSVAPPSTVADNIDQQVMFVEKADKNDLLVDVIKGDGVERVLVFTATKIAASAVAKYLDRNGLPAEAIHSNKTQSQRQKALESFTKGKVKILVATDIVSRGIDVDGISHVVNYELPDEAENYIHRIGRTARAGRKGVAVTLCCVEDISNLRGVQTMLKQPLRVIDDHRFHSVSAAGCLIASEKAARQRARTGRGRGSGSKWAR